MLKKERQAYILQQVNLNHKVLSSVLCQEIRVSEDTIRRDLQELADSGHIIKVHGGALSHSFNEVFQPTVNVYSQEYKKIIAQKAAALIRNGMLVLTTGGTTMIQMARMLPADLKATFITGSIPVLLEYMQHPSIDVIMIGDRLSKNARITIGTEAIAKVKQVNPDLCLMGINALNLKHGITDNDWEVVQLKKAMIRSAQKTVCLTISEKLNTLQPIHIADIQHIDILITELPADDPKLKPYRDAGIQVL
jgi:DeoR/GlpR family transcriptional regulator of sugar metabolism